MGEGEGGEESRRTRKALVADENETSLRRADNGNLPQSTLTSKFKSHPESFHFALLSYHKINKGIYKKKKNNSNFIAHVSLRLSHLAVDR